ncbi:MAG: hypothetical protein ACTSR3_14385 [Candidatus Helarchaeota archaeon]
MLIREKWTALLLVSIILQFIIYFLTWFLKIVEHELLWIVIMAGFLSIIAQIIGYFSILNKAKNLDTNIFSKGKTPKEKQVPPVKIEDVSQ